MATMQCDLLFDVPPAEVAPEEATQSFELVSRAAGKTFTEFLMGLLNTDSRAARDALFIYTIVEHSNQYANNPHDKYNTWDASLESGRSYLVGDTYPMDKFLKDFRRELTPWQKLAFEWCTANPERSLHMESRHERFYYVICRRGEFVEFGLPHQDQGGEKHWISRDGKTKIKVNDD